MSELHRLTSRTTQDGHWLDLLCGLRRVCERVDELLARHVPGAPTAGPASPEIVDALLGVIAIRERLRAQWSDAIEQRVPASAAEPSRIAESLLR